MAGEQDIVMLGLNIDSFNEKKKQKLKEFIELFNDLSKYDGKIFNPVMGDGLTKFNTSIAETNRLVDELNVKISKLNSTGVRGQAFPTAQVREFKRATDEASSSTEKFTVNAGGTKDSLANLGKNMTHLLTNLRYIAYILPGIGIAGIFNLAFDAIGNAADALIDFTDHEKDLHEINRDINKDLAEQISSWEKLDEIQKAYYNNFLNIGVASGQSFLILRDQEKKLSDDIARGYEQGKILNEQLDVSKKKYEQALTDVAGYKNTDGGYNLNIQLRQLNSDILTEMQEMRSAKAQSDRFAATISNKGIDDGGNINTQKDYFTDKGGKKDAVERAKLLKEEQDARFSAAKAKYDSLKNLLDTYLKAETDLSNKQQEIQKFNSDQERKLLVERTRDNISLALAANKTILDSDKKFHDEKEDAIKKQYNLEKQLAATNRINVTGTKENPNVGATPNEIKIAVNKESDDIEKASIKRDEALLANDIEFYQRKIKAIKDINKDETEAEARKNETIYKNEQKSLNERLEAYNKYIQLKQKIKDYEFGVDIQKAADKPGGLAALTPEEKDALSVHRDSEQKEISANGEKQVYDIVYTSLKGIIKDTVDLIKTEEDLSKEGYTKALEALNKSYDDKKISLTRYKEERKKIDNKYEKLELDQQIKQDEESLKLIEATYSERIQLEVDYRRALLATAQEGGNQTEIDKAKGAVDAAEQAETDIQKNIKVAQDKLSADKLRRAKIGPYDDEKELAKWVDAAVRVEKKITDTIEKLHDQRIENQIAYIERQKELMDEQYAHEAQAIEDSTLKQKDKQALEIQIEAEKREMAVNAANEEKRLQIEQFNFNKKLALANAAVGIAAAIIKDGLTTPKSLADAAIGLIEVGAILAAQPPSFAEGVDYLPFTMKARYGEAGPELVKKPGQPAFVAMSETISTLPKGTQIIPLRSDYPEFNNEKKDDSWEQTKFLAKQIKSSKKEITNIFKPTIVVDMNFESRKRQILGN